MIEWKESYKVGIGFVDEQHKKLFEISNRAYELLEDQFCIDKYDKIVDILEELKDYTVYHFNEEEKYMKSIGYSDYLSQKVAHDGFIKKIFDIDLNKVDQEQDKYLKDVLKFVVDWIIGHIISRDKLIPNG